MAAMLVLLMAGN